MKHIAYVISPHGFGHAARACAVINAVFSIDRNVHFHIFTSIGKWFFDECVPDTDYTYHNKLTDIGFIQRDPVTEDIEATLTALSSFYPLKSEAVDSMAAAISHNHCQIVISDIAPIGIAAANQIGVPSVLVENFTWDFIYKGYLEVAPRFEKFIGYLESQFASSNYHIQIPPTCVPVGCDLYTNTPVVRSLRLPRGEVRDALGISPSDTMVLATMGGTPASYPFIDQLCQTPDFQLVIPGVAGATNAHVANNNVHILPRHSNFYHPDLVNAADVVIGKLGYSTVSEIAQARVPFAYLARPYFPESPILADYVDQHAGGRELALPQLRSNKLSDTLRELATSSRPSYPKLTGADDVARFITELIRA